MNQIKNSFSSIEQMTSQLRQPAKRAAEKSAGKSFESILLGKGRQETAEGAQDDVSKLKFSKHANERLMNRSIDLSEEQVRRLQAGAAKAQQKGIVESLVMVDSYAFIVNTRSQIVVTAVAEGDDRVFTNIDGAVIG
ncbi:MAG: flagellar protein [Lachnospiraceae bacterium]|nr:flagellar protein [Lachnospiraceae bacterium]